MVDFSFNFLNLLVLQGRLWLDEPDAGSYLKPIHWTRVIHQAWYTVRMTGIVSIWLHLVLHCVSLIKHLEPVVDALEIKMLFQREGVNFSQCVCILVSLSLATWFCQPVSQPSCISFS